MELNEDLNKDFRRHFGSGLWSLVCRHVNMASKAPFLFVIFLVCGQLELGVNGLCSENGVNKTCHDVRKRSLLLEKRVCYQDLGCFSNGPPFYHPIYRPLSVVPQSPEKINTMFHLYTRRNRNRPVFLSVKRGRNVKKTTFNPTALTRMIIHGVNDNQYINSWFQRLKDVMLDRADENVIIVDWSGSNRLPYTIAVANCRVVGAVIAQFINYLYKTTGASPESFHLLGHSLGAHVAGYAGERLHKLGRITGLDPAGPFYRKVPDNVRLDPSDAVFVDIIHSDPGETILEGYGTPEDAGDLDFYPGGGDPPGCDKTLVRSIVEDRPTEALGNLVSCQHYRSYEFFIWSFNQKGCLFVGVECPTWEDFLKGYCDCGVHGERCAIMGIFAPTYAFTNGEHYSDRRLFLKVGLERPFCVHQYQLIMHLHTIGGHATYGHDVDYAEVTIRGKLEKLKVKLHVGVNHAETIQEKKFLVSANHPIGEVVSATISFISPGHYKESSPQHHGYAENTIVEKIEVNYLYPLPKALTSSLLCRTSETLNMHGGKAFILTPHCY